MPPRPAKVLPAGHTEIIGYMQQHPTVPPPPPPLPAVDGPETAGSRGARPEVRLRDALLGVAVVVVATIVTGGALAVWALTSPTVHLGSPSFVIGAMAATSASLLAGAAPTLLRRHVGLRALGFVRVTVTWLVIAIAGALALRVVTLVVALTGTLVFGAPAENPQADQFGPLLEGGIASTSFVAFAVFAVVVAPLVEEVLFRGVLFRGLRSRMRFVWAAGLSSLLFGLMHGLGILLVATGLVGFFCAWVYERSGSLWTAIATHAAFNATAVAVLPLVPAP